MNDAVIRLLADTAQYERAMVGAEATTARFTSALGAVSGAFVAVAALAAAAEVVAFSKSVIAAQDDLGKMSQKVGISVEALAGLQHAVDLSGGSSEGLQTALKGLSTQMFDAATGAKESQLNFARLSVQVADVDGTMRDADAVLLQVAERFASMPDGVEKSALAVKLFGRAGLDMIPLLNGGSAALAGMIAEGQKFNPVTTESAKQAEQFNDNLARVQKSASAAGIAILNDMLPRMTDISEAMAVAAREAGFFQAALVGLGGLFAAAFTDDLLTRPEQIGQELEQLRSMLDDELSAPRWLMFSDAMQEKHNAQIAAINSRMLSLQQELGLIQATSAAEEKKAADAKKAAATAAAIAAAKARAAEKALAESEAAAKAYQSVQKHAADYINTLEKEGQQLGLNSIQQKMIEASLEAMKLKTDAERSAVMAAAGAWAIKRANLDAAAEASKAVAVAMQEAFDAEERERLAVEKSIGGLREKIESLESETSLMGLSADERERAIMLHALEAEKVKLTAEAYTQLRERMEAALGAAASRRAAVKAAEEYVQSWKKGLDDTDRMARELFTDFAMHGEGAAERIGNALRTALLSAIYEATLKPFVAQIYVAATNALGVPGAPGVGGAGNMLSSANSAYSLFNNFSTTPFSSALGRASSTGFGQNLLGGGVDEAGYAAAVLRGEDVTREAFTYASTEFGQAAQQFAGAVDAYGGYVNAAYQLSEGNYGAAIGAAVGQYFGGPIGSFIGSTLGGLLDGGGGGQKVVGRTAYDPISNAMLQPGMDGYQYHDERGGKAMADAIALQLGESMQAAILKLGGDPNGYTSRVYLSQDPDGDSPGEANTGWMRNGVGGDYHTNTGRSSEEFQKAFETQTTRALLGALSDADLSDWADAIADSINPATASLEEMNAALAKLNGMAQLVPVFEALGLSAGDMSTSLVDALGGFDAAGATLNSYYENYFSEEEKAARLREQITEQLAAVNLAMPETEEAFRGMVEEAGPEAFAALMRVQGAFKTLAQSAGDVVDAESAIKAARDNASRSVDTALASLSRAVDAEKTRIEAEASSGTELLRQQIESMSTAQSAASDTLSSLTSIVDSVGSAVDGLRGKTSAGAAWQMESARAYVDMAWSLAQAGTMPDQRRLGDALAALARDSTDAYASFADFEYAQLVQAGKLEKLGKLAGDQKSVAERQVDAAKQQIMLAESQIGAIESSASAQMVALDTQLEAAQSQVDILRGIDTSVLSVADAVRSLGTLITLAKDAGVGNTVSVSSAPTAGGATYTAATDTWTSRDGAQSGTTAGVAAAIDVYLQSGNIAGLYTASKEVGFTLADINRIHGDAPGTMEQWARDNGLPQFAVGTNYVPRDMVAQIHQGETITPRPYVDLERSSREETNALMRKLVETNAALEKRLAAIEGNTKPRMADEERPLRVQVMS